jgi:hypothetical protein
MSSLPYPWQFPGARLGVGRSRGREELGLTKRWYCGNVRMHATL